MKLTKDSQNGFNLWIVEHKGQGVARLRMMYQADTKKFDVTDPENRQRIAAKLWQLRRDLRELAAAPPPTK